MALNTSAYLPPYPQPGRRGNDRTIIIFAWDGRRFCSRVRYDPFGNLLGVTAMTPRPPKPSATPLTDAVWKSGNPTEMYEHAKALEIKCGAVRQATVEEYAPLVALVRGALDYPTSIIHGRGEIEQFLRALSAPKDRREHQRDSLFFKQYKSADKRSGKDRRQG